MEVAELEASRSTREAELALRMPVTGNSAEYLLPYYEIGFQTSMRGKKALDVCAGGSNLTAALGSTGADAYAVDLGYLDKNTHRRILSEGVNSPNRDFLSSQDASPDRYIGKSATDLPFPDESFDAIFSFNGIFGVLDEDPELLRLALDEAVRVLKRGGKLQIGPYLDVGNISESVKARQEEEVARLKERGDLVVFDGFSPYPVEPRRGFRQFRKLVIKKRTTDRPNNEPIPQGEVGDS